MSAETSSSMRREGIFVKKWTKKKQKMNIHDLVDQPKILNTILGVRESYDRKS